MPMSVVYTRIGGQLVAETRNGVCTQYMSDTEGNLIGEINEQGEVTYRCEYWPFGEVREETGTKRSEWGFAGLLGCMTDSPSSIYMRARVYRPNYARWQTAARLWPQQPPYEYAANQPTMQSDPSGMTKQLPWEPRPKGKPDPSMGQPPLPSNCQTCKCWNDYVFSYCNQCHRGWNPDITCRTKCSYLADWYYRSCKGPRPWNNWPPLFQPWQPMGPPFGIPSPIVPGNPPYTGPCPPRPHNWGFVNDAETCRESLKTCLNGLGSICNTGSSIADPICYPWYLSCMANYILCLGNIVPPYNKPPLPV